MTSGKHSGDPQWKTQGKNMASGKQNYISMKLNLKLEPVLTGYKIGSGKQNPQWKTKPLVENKIGSGKYKWFEPVTKFHAVVENKICSGKHGGKIIMS